jgi:hypothetical protein
MKKRLDGFRTLSRWHTTMLCALGIFFSGCGTTPQVTSPPADSPPSANVPTTVPSVLRPQWFWNPSWWVNNGPLAQEVIDLINQNPAALQGVRRVNYESNGGSASDPFDFSTATQNWDSASGYLNVFIPLTSGRYASAALVMIKPIWNFFGPHVGIFSGASFFNLKEVRFSAPGVIVTPASSGGSAPPSSNRIYVSTSVPINTDGSSGKFRATWYNATTSRVVQTLVSTQNTNRYELSDLLGGRISAAGIEKCYIDPVTLVCQAPTPPPCGGGQMVTQTVRALSCGPGIGSDPSRQSCKDLVNTLKSKQSDAEASTNAVWVAVAGGLYNCVFTDPLTRFGKCIIGGVAVVITLGNEARKYADFTDVLKQWTDLGCDKG